MLSEVGRTPKLPRGVVAPTELTTGVRPVTSPTLVSSWVVMPAHLGEVYYWSSVLIKERFCYYYYVL
jgi:hypothetical protein